jgi:hypothetical protein
MGRRTVSQREETLPRYAGFCSGAVLSFNDIASCFVLRALMRAWTSRNRFSDVRRRPYEKATAKVSPPGKQEWENEKRGERMLGGSTAR